MEGSFFLFQNWVLQYSLWLQFIVIMEASYNTHMTSINRRTAVELLLLDSNYCEPLKKKSTSFVMKLVCRPQMGFTKNCSIIDTESLIWQRFVSNHICRFWEKITVYSKRFLLHNITYFETKPSLYKMTMWREKRFEV